MSFYGEGGFVLATIVFLFNSLLMPSQLFCEINDRSDLVFAAIFEELLSLLSGTFIVVRKLLLLLMLPRKGKLNVKGIAENLFKSIFISLQNKMNP